MTEQEPADAVQLLRDGLDLVRRGRAMVQAAENLGATLDPRSEPLVDFNSLPGRSPEARAEALYAGRRIRDGIFPQGVFSEPAWDIMLALFLADRSGKAINVETVFPECHIPRSTGNRHVAHLIELGLVEMRDAGPEQSATLSAMGSRLIRRFFELTEGSAPASRKAFTPFLRLIAGGKA